MKPENVKCPDCQGPMESRMSVHGAFWGCKSYPKCRGTRDADGRSKADRDADQQHYRGGVTTRGS